MISFRLLLSAHKTVSFPVGCFTCNRRLFSTSSAIIGAFSFLEIETNRHRRDIMFSVNSSKPTIGVELTKTNVGLTEENISVEAGDRIVDDDDDLLEVPEVF